MKQLYVALLMLAYGQASLAVRVDGYCYLEGQTDHSGTKVEFIGFPRSSVFADSTFTELSGYYRIDLAAGVYDVGYTHRGWQGAYVEDQVIETDIILPSTTLFRHLSGSLSGTFESDKYRIIDTISVQPNDTLRLPPGTSFHFDGPYPFYILGTLLAEGTQANPIVFTTDTHTNPDRWRGLRFSNWTSSGSVLDHCLIENGFANGPPWWPSNYGGGLSCDGSSPTFNNTIIAFSNGEGVHLDNSAGTQITHCDIFGNTGGAFEADVSAEFGEIVTTNVNGDSCDVYRNIFLNPRFVNAGEEDFHLESGSPCIGAGDLAQSPPADIEGDARPNPIGSRPDIGAYENESAIPLPLEGLSGSQTGTLGPSTYPVVSTIFILTRPSRVRSDLLSPLQRQMLRRASRANFASIRTTRIHLTQQPRFAMMSRRRSSFLWRYLICLVGK